MLQTNTKTGKTRELRVVGEERPSPKAKAAPRPVPSPYGGPAAEQALHGAVPGAAPGAYGGPAHGHGRPGHDHSRPEYGHAGGYAPQPGYMVEGKPVA